MNFPFFWLPQGFQQASCWSTHFPLSPNPINLLRRFWFTGGNQALARVGASWKRQAKKEAKQDEFHIATHCDLEPVQDNSGSAKSERAQVTPRASQRAVYPACAEAGWGGTELAGLSLQE